MSSVKVWFKGEAYPAPYKFLQFVGLNDMLAHSYWDVDGAIFTYTNDEFAGGMLRVEPSTPARRVLLERRMLAEIVATRGKVEGAKVIAWREVGCAARIARRQSKKQIWILSDRPMKAGDNGEALFTYLCEHPLDNV